MPYFRLRPADCAPGGPGQRSERRRGPSPEQPGHTENAVEVERAGIEPVAGGAEDAITGIGRIEVARIDPVVEEAEAARTRDPPQLPTDRQHRVVGVVVIDEDEVVRLSSGRGSATGRGRVVPNERDVIGQAQP